MLLAAGTETVHRGDPEVAASRVEDHVELLGRSAYAQFAIVLAAVEGLQDHGDACFASKVRTYFDSVICFWWIFKNSSMRKVSLALKLSLMPKKKAVCRSRLININLSIK